MESAIDKYILRCPNIDNNFLREIVEELTWVAESKKDARMVSKATECFLLDEVMDMATKYKNGVSSEVFLNIVWCIDQFIDVNLAKKYTSWLNSDLVSKLLNFATEFSGNENLKMKKDIFSILNVDATKLDNFSEFASKISNKRIILQKKIELLSMLRDIVNYDKNDYAEILVKKGLDELINKIKSDLNDIKLLDNIFSLKCGIKFVEDLKSNPNISFLYENYRKYGSIRKWMLEDETTKNVIKKIEDAGIDSGLYVASGKKIAERRIEGHFSDNWTNVLRTIVLKVVGNKKNGILPKVSIPNQPPGVLFKVIKKDYALALNDNREAAKRILKRLKNIMTKSYFGRAVPKSAKNLLDDVECLEKVLLYGGTVSFKGAKVYAKVWKRKIPEDLYDSEKLRCCIFLPSGEFKEEIPLFVMDPKTTLLQFFIEGIDEPVAAASFYAGMYNGKPAMLMDTWEAGGVVYAALGHDKMKDFVLEGMKKFTKKVGAKKLLIFAKAPYGRPAEFCNYLRGDGLESRNAMFEGIDSEDSVLAKYSQNEKHHYTDAFEKTKILSGEIDAFVIDV